MFQITFYNYKNQGISRGRISHLFLHSKATYLNPQGISHARVKTLIE